MNGLLEENKPENTERKIYPTQKKRAVRATFSINYSNVLCATRLNISIDRTCERNGCQTMHSFSYQSAH
jgi:hypothetical protein